MSKRTIHKLLQETVEEEISADNVDLWPKIDQRMEAKPAPALKRRHAIRLVYRVALVLLIGTAAFLMTPQGRSLAQEYLPQFFERSDANSYPVPSEVFVTLTVRAEMRATETQFATEHPEIPTITPTITPTPAPGNYLAATEDIADIEEQLGYDVLVPAWMPEGFTFTGGSADLEKGIAYQFYAVPIRSNGLTISQYPADLEMESPTVPERQAIQLVDINGNTGEYVQGTWMSNSDGTEWVWRTDPYIQRLYWEQDGMIFYLMYFGQQWYMDKNDMIDVAESMH